MLKTLGTFFATIAKNVASKTMAAAGPAAKQALSGMDPKLEFQHSLKVHSKDSRLHAVASATLDASVNLPGELDDMAADTLNASGIVGLGNSQPGSTPDGNSHNG